ncbi:hypothetical protein KC19_VG273200 [Ceratodon purpureus]|uniref:Uncharacterized protein n=1 Tax=Ceratodon purpureus TaxID=3225 RepID=A0A8T0HUV1_CERPU|nr:hypothetical protein KC19_VG273200 [Ceratodon purpureus]
MNVVLTDAGYGMSVLSETRNTNGRCCGLLTECRRQGWEEGGDHGDYGDSLGAEDCAAKELGENTKMERKEKNWEGEEEEEGGWQRDMDVLREFGQERKDWNSLGGEILEKGLAWKVAAAPYRCGS